MIKALHRRRFLLSRRLVQFGLLLLFAGANWWGWKILMGNYSSSYIMESFYLADPYAVLQTFATGFVISIDAILGATIVLVFYAFIGGRSFCSWVCPVNIITDLASWCRNKWRLTTIDKNIRLSRNTRYWILILGIILSPLAGVAAFEVINPIGILHRGIIFGFGIGWTILVALFLFDLLVVDYGWCGHLCPLGAFYTGIGRFALIKVKHKAEKCTMCMKCFGVCHEEQVLHIIGNESGHIKGACSNCGRCVEVCDNKALKYSIYNYKN
jgi:ferredoxin-type protein NapH